MKNKVIVLLIFLPIIASCSPVTIEKEITEYIYDEKGVPVQT